MNKLNYFISHPIKSITAWFRDNTFRQLMQNASWLLSGKVIAALLSLISTALRTRSLGVDQFGVFALILAYVALIEQLTTFRSWEALIKFGAESLKNENYRRFISQVKLSLRLDIFGAVTGTAISIAGAYLFASLMNWSQETSQMIMVFSFSLLFNLSGTSTGILRLLNRFELQTAKDVIIGTLAFTGALLTYLFDWGLWGFLIATLISTILGHILLFSMSMIAIRKLVLKNQWHSPIKEWKPFVQFSLWTYITSVLEVPVKKMDIIIVASVTSVETAGIYKIIKQASTVLAILADPIYQAIYPQFALMIAKGTKKAATKYAIKIGLLLLAITGIPASIMAVTSFWWLGAIFGESFAVGAVPLIVFLIFKVLDFSFNPIHPLFTAMGFVKQNSFISLLTNLLYLILAWKLGNQFGLTGLALAYGLGLGFRITCKNLFIAFSSKQSSAKSIPTSKTK